MATYQSNAIIVGRHDFGEADRVIVLLTPENGIIRAVAKGVRKIKSRLAGHLELFSESELMLYKGKNMDTITSARLLNHLNVSDDYDRMRLAYLFSEMVNRLGGEHEHHNGLYELTHHTLTMLGVHPANTTLELWFKLRLLAVLGYKPELNACMICEVADANRAYYFNVELGGIVDLGCSGPGNPAMTTDQIKVWRLMMSRSFDAVQAIPGINKIATETMPICNLFYDYTFGKRFKADEVLT